MFSVSPASVPCAALPGTVVATILTTGGNGNRVFYKLGDGGTDFRLRRNAVIVAAIDPSHCGSIRTLNVTARQAAGGANRQQRRSAK